MDPIVRIKKIRLENFKNTAYGEISMPNTEKNADGEYSADIVGIYGQNGSGKTAVIETLGIIHVLLAGRELAKFPLKDYIMSGKQECILFTEFIIDGIDELEDRQCSVEYQVTFGMRNGGTFIHKETLSASAVVNSKRVHKTLIQYDSIRDFARFAPKTRFASIENTEKNKIALGVAQKLSMENTSSFIFNRDCIRLFLDTKWNDSFNVGKIAAALANYGLINLCVIMNVHSALVSLGYEIPLAVLIENEDEAFAGDIQIYIDKPTVVNKEKLVFVDNVLQSINCVLNELIPGLTIDIHNYGDEMLANGEIGARIEYVSCRGNVKIPLRYESEGIIKLVTILHVLISVYSNPTVCLAIDELDSGIFEYLLGEILSVISDSGKGQIIFTSHNLRPLEKLNKESLVFSTTNPDNRYIRLQNVKRNNNMRDMYLRSILLGGQAEELYSETNTSKIARAFRKAERAMHNEE